MTPTTGFELEALTLSLPLPLPLTLAPTLTLTRFELETEFTLTAPNWNGEGNLHYTYVAEETLAGVTTTTILGHGQKKTTLSGIILNKGDFDNDDISYT